MAIKKQQWIEATLLNDEYATDQEMTEYFIKEGRCTQEEAAFYVGQRNDALRLPFEFKLKIWGTEKNRELQAERQDPNRRGEVNHD